MTRSRNSRRGIKHQHGQHTPYEGCEHCFAKATKADVANNIRRLRAQGSAGGDLAEYRNW